jgi:hypothetical protein
VEIRIVEEKWTAEIICSPQPQASDQLNHVQAKTLGLTKEDALAGAQFVLDLFAKGRLAYIRAMPEAHSDKVNFSKTEMMTNTGDIIHQGYVRFSFRCEDGDWHYPESDVVQLRGFGSLEAQV